MVLHGSEEFLAWYSMDWNSTWYSVEYDDELSVSQELIITVSQELSKNSTDAPAAVPASELPLILAQLNLHAKMTGLLQPVTAEQLSSSYGMLLNSAEACHWRGFLLSPRICDCASPFAGASCTEQIDSTLLVDEGGGTTTKDSSSAQDASSPAFNRGKYRDYTEKFCGKKLSMSGGVTDADMRAIFKKDVEAGIFSAPVPDRALNVLDLCAGCGGLVALLREWNISNVYMGMDLSEEAAHFVRERYFENSSDKSSCAQPVQCWHQHPFFGPRRPFRIGRPQFGTSTRDQHGFIFSTS